jgi:hypothetical protein
MLLAVFFVIGQATINGGFDQQVVKNAVKFIFALVTIIFFNSNLFYQNQYFLKTFEIIIVFNSLLIIFGFIFDYYLLETYRGSRFGYNGLLISSATSTYFYFIALSHLFLKYRKQFLFNPITVITIIAAVFLGTKTIYLAILFFAYLILVEYYSNVSKRLIILVFGIIFGFVIYFLTFNWGVFIEISSSNGPIASITSFRSEIIKQQTLPYIQQNWNFINYIFGGIPDMRIRPQIFILDVICFFGLVGALLYIFLIYKAYINFELTRLNWLILGFLFLAINLTGNFFINSSVIIYFLLLRESMKKYVLTK